MLFDLSCRIDWEAYRQKKQERVRHYNARENKKRVPWTYKVGDLVFKERDKLQRKLKLKRDGPFRVVKVYTNGTIQIQDGVLTERVSIRRLTPYKGPLSQDVAVGGANAQG